MGLLGEAEQRQEFLTRLWLPQFTHTTLGECIVELRRALEGGAQRVLEYPLHDEHCQSVKGV